MYAITVAAIAMVVTTDTTHIQASVIFSFVSGFKILPSGGGYCVCLRFRRRKFEIWV